MVSQLRDRSRISFRLAGFLQPSRSRFCSQRLAHKVLFLPKKKLRNRRIRNPTSPRKTSLRPLSLERLKIKRRRKIRSS